MTDIPPPRTRKRPPLQETAPLLHDPAPPAHIIHSFACPCGFRDEVKHPAPNAVDCLGCGRKGTCIRIRPRYEPPKTAGRFATALEIASMRIDGGGD